MARIVRGGIAATVAGIVLVVFTSQSVPDEQVAPGAHADVAPTPAPPPALATPRRESRMAEIQARYERSVDWATSRLSQSIQALDAKEYTAEYKAAQRKYLEAYAALAIRRARDRAQAETDLLECSDETCRRAAEQRKVEASQRLNSANQAVQRLRRAAMGVPRQAPRARPWIPWAPAARERDDGKRFVLTPEQIELLTQPAGPP